MCCVGATCSDSNRRICIYRDLKIGGVDTYVNIGNFPMCPPVLEFVDSDVGVLL